MSATREEQYRRSRNAQVLALLFSLIFFAAIAYGWFNLFLKFGAFIALVAAVIGAVTAWFLARELGENPSRRVLYVPLIAISALGVYNSMMLYLEGQQLLVDTVAQSQEKFSALQASARSALGASGASKHIAHVQSLSDSLFSETKNPLNCGQGPHARELIADLQGELPGFTPLSATKNDCARNAAVIDDYQTRIAALIERASWNDPGLVAIGAAADRARGVLDGTRADIAADYAPTKLPHIVSGLEAQDAVYRDLRDQLSHRTDVKDLAPGLPLQGAQSLGNIARLPALIWDRRDQWSTYVYLAVAVSFDLFMVYLFAMVAGSRPRRHLQGHGLGSAL